MEFDEVLPGTRRIYDANGNPLESDAGLKKSGDIVLVPQPTESPNDPLHWALPRKIWHSSLVCFVTALTAATSNDAGSAQYVRENLFRRNFISLSPPTSRGLSSLLMFFSLLEMPGFADVPCATPE